MAMLPTLFQLNEPLKGYKTYRGTPICPQ